MKNEVLADKTLSLKAKGLFIQLCFMFKKSGGYCSIKEIRQYSTDGSDSIRSAISELELHKYLVRERRTYVDGTFAGTYYRLAGKGFEDEN